MKKKMLGSCPVCESSLEVTKLECSKCGTSIGGKFEVCKFCRLDSENKAFIETFIKCRGNIKEVENELNISYPTVRSRLDRVIAALGYKIHDAEANQVDRMSVLKEVEDGKMSVDEALKKMRGDG